MVERGDARGRGRELWEGKGRVVVKILAFYRLLSENIARK